MSSNPSQYNFNELNRELQETIQTGTSSLVDPIDPWSVEFSSQFGVNQLPHNPFLPNYSVGSSISYPTSPPHLNVQSVSTIPAIATQLQHTAEPVGFYLQKEPIDTPFDPNKWISTVMSLSIAKPVNCTLAELIRESESFQSTIVDKIPFMRQNHSTTFTPSMFDSLEVRIRKRNLALQSTVSSLCDFEMTCNAIENDLNLISNNLSRIEALPFPEIIFQLEELNTVGAELASIELLISTTNVEFGVIVENEAERIIYDRKSELYANYTSILGRQQQLLNQTQADNQQFDRNGRADHETYNRSFDLNLQPTVKNITIDMKKLKRDYDVLSEDNLLTWFEDKLVVPLEEMRSQTTGLACPAIVRMVLLKTKLNVDHIKDIFSKSHEEREQIIEDLIEFKEPSTQFPIMIQDEEKPCGTCYCDGNEQLISTGYCDHYVCEDCFKMNYKTEIEKGSLAVKCYGGPNNDCKQLYNDDLLAMFTHEVDVNVGQDKTILNVVVESAKTSKHNWFLVPCTRTANCQYFFQINKEIMNTTVPSSTTLRCKCGASYCCTNLLREQNLIEGAVGCEEVEGHEPLSCEHFKYFNSVGPEEYKTTRSKKVVDKENREFIEQYTRPCPRCKRRIYRSEGCNHMTCLCGNEFNWTSYSGGFDENVAEIQEVTVDEEKQGGYDRTIEKIQMNKFDLDVLTFRFKGQDQALLSNFANQTLGSNNHEDTWAVVTDSIQNQFNFGFAFPWHYLSDVGNISGSLSLFDGTLLITITSSLETITRVTKTLESLLKFKFLIKQNKVGSTLAEVYSSTRVERMINDLHQRLEKSRKLGTELANALVNIQGDSLNAYEVLIEDINTKASSWLKACDSLEAMADSRLSAIKAENKLKFWKNDTTHMRRENLFEAADITIDQGSEESPSKKKSVFTSLTSLFSRR